VGRLCDERFAKTAVGWILREISKHGEPWVRKEIADNIKDFSTESLKNATKYFQDGGKSYMQMHRDAHQKARGSRS
jgi:3-methyladenine DNA glycosylase AlkD